MDADLIRHHRPKLVAIAVLALPTWAAIELYLSSGDQADVGGRRAAMRLSGYWPSEVAPEEISHAYVHQEWAIDMTHTYIQARCSQETASKWDRWLEQQWQAEAQGLKLDYDVTTQQLAVPMPRSSSAPSWWQLSGSTANAYLTCASYPDHQSAWGYGKYLTYDADSQILMIYEFDEQNFRLLPPP